MSVLTATLSTIWLFWQVTRPTIWAVPRPISSIRQPATARKTRVLVLTRRLRCLLALLRGVLGAVTVSFDRKPGYKRPLDGDCTELGKI